jgi:hypothetical protein
VLPSFDATLPNAKRLNLLRIADWISFNRLPVIMETPAQAVVVLLFINLQIVMQKLISKMDSQKIKAMVRQKYSEIALQEKKTSCCSSGCCSTELYNIMSED